MCQTEPVQVGLNNNNGDLRFDWPACRQRQAQRDKVFRDALAAILPLAGFNESIVKLFLSK